MNTAIYNNVYKPETEESYIYYVQEGLPFHCS